MLHPDLHTCNYAQFVGGGWSREENRNDSVTSEPGKETAEMSIEHLNIRNLPGSRPKMGSKVYNHCDLLFLVHSRFINALLYYCLSAAIYRRGWQVGAEQAVGELNDLLAMGRRRVLSPPCSPPGSPWRMQTCNPGNPVIFCLLVNKYISYQAPVSSRYTVFDVWKCSIPLLLYCEVYLLSLCLPNLT